MRQWIGFLLLGALSCVFLMQGCAGGVGSSFPTAQEIVSQGAAKVTDTDRLQRGRQLFASRCTECHVARRIGSYSVAQWRHYIGIMAPRAALTAEDRAAVEDYIVKSREALPPG